MYDFQINIKNIVRAIARPVHGMYEGLNFGPVTKGFKVCYIRLSEDLDPQQVVERINHAEIVKKGSKLHAFIPTYVPVVSRFLLITISQYAFL